MRGHIGTGRLTHGRHPSSRVKALVWRAGVECEPRVDGDERSSTPPITSEDAGQISSRSKAGYNRNCRDWVSWFRLTRNIGRYQPWYRLWCRLAGWQIVRMTIVPLTSHNTRTTESNPHTPRPEWKATRVPRLTRRKPHDESAGKYRNHKMWDEYPSNGSRHTVEGPLNIPIFIVLPRGFITTHLLPLPKCIQHEEEGEGGIRPGGFEPLLVFAVPFPPCSPVSGSLSAILVAFFPREPPFPVDLSPLSW